MAGCEETLKRSRFCSPILLLHEGSGTEAWRNSSQLTTHRPHFTPRFSKFGSKLLWHLGNLLTRNIPRISPSTVEFWESQLEVQAKEPTFSVESSEDTQSTQNSASKTWNRHFYFVLLLLLSLWSRSFDQLRMNQKLIVTMASTCLSGRNYSKISVPPAS